MLDYEAKISKIEKRLEKQQFALLKAVADIQRLHKSGVHVDKLMLDSTIVDIKTVFLKINSALRSYENPYRN